ncbi:hypothetical protein AQUCO_03900081v1 [Aquilegia coerulea]|uniref:Terpene synthase metal-binding domain-containing protein n=1 Tax=Aquilegia coerulea TaxID=218851 RepID=A0A2G5CRZ8_AQUCA|nr:hypothetical protein AQUCO_03900081v1 [Aquilegia coerulea]
MAFASSLICPPIYLSPRLKPSFWDLDNLTLLTSEYKEDIYKQNANELQEKVRQALNDSVGSAVGNLDFIDVVQRLGLRDYYKENIKRALDNEFINNNQLSDDDLYTTSLRFWLLRQHGYDVHQDWLHAGYTPTLKEYLENAVVSIGGPFVLVSAYLLTAGKITKEALDYIESMPSLIYNSSMLTRLANDLGTSSDEIARGDNPKSIRCYMHEKGVSEEAARDHIKYLINETWKKMNKAIVASYPFLDEPFISSAPNLGRQSQCIYQYGDGHGIPDQETKDRIKSLFIEPIPLGKI